MARRSTREEVLDGVLELVVAGALGVGDEAKTSELWIAEQLGVSRTPVREALAVLAQEGMIVRRPQVGVWIRAVSSAEVAELCEDSRELEALALQTLLEQTPSDLEVELRHALLDLEHAAARLRLTKPTDDRFVSSQDAYLRAETALHRLICDRGGRAFAGRSVEALEVKRRIFHVEHPIAPDRVEALVEANTDLVARLLEATDPGVATRALLPYYRSLAATYDSDEPASLGQIRWVNQRLERIEEEWKPGGAEKREPLTKFEALGELIDLSQFVEDAIPADDQATRERIRKLIAELRPLLSMTEPPGGFTAPSMPQAGDRRLLRARPQVIREG